MFLSEAINPYKTTNGFVPVETYPPFNVFCDYDGWLIIQRHSLGGTTNFNQTWQVYKDGFGDINGQDFWLGLNRIHTITSQQGEKFMLQVMFMDEAGMKFYVQYKEFTLGNEEDSYRLTVRNFTGTTSDELSQSNGAIFTTWDRTVNSEISYDNCAFLHGAWWYSSEVDCGRARINSEPLQWAEMQNITSVEMRIREMSNG